MSKLHSVTAMCPTYGRFHRLRDSAACFILQEYEGHKEMNIINDAEVPIKLSYGNENTIQLSDGSRINIFNRGERCKTLGAKRQELVDISDTDLLAHWDDDDLFLPWHFSTWIPYLEHYANTEGSECVKPRVAWFCGGKPGEEKAESLYRQRFDGQMIYINGTQIEYDSNLERRVPRMVAHAFKEKGTLLAPSGSVTKEMYSYIYRRHDDVRHLHKIGSNAPNLRIQRLYSAKNKDFGNNYLVPVMTSSMLKDWAIYHLRPMFERFGKSLYDVARLPEEVAARVNTKIQLSLGLEKW